MHIKIVQSSERSVEVSVHIMKDFTASDFSLSLSARGLESKLEKGELVEIYSASILHLLARGPQSGEACRNLGASILHSLRERGFEQCSFHTDCPADELKDIIFGIYSSAYTFDKYKTDKRFESTLELILPDVDTSSLEAELSSVLQGVFTTRDLVNEPYNKLDVSTFCALVSQYGDEYGFSTEVLGKDQIESLKMGGLLGVNKGSVNPPAFMILTLEDGSKKDSAPIVLVGKGVMFDTGGLNIKTPWKHMYDMKSDMGGAATVVGTFIALAKAGIRRRVIGLLPLTDNRPGGEAMTPGDILTMHNGKTVEVLNTDAEGRLILADALSFAKKYNPKCVIDLATLTGSAVMTFGHIASAVMSNDTALLSAIKLAGATTGENVAELPLWEEYGEALKSEIADIKNLGEPEAGAISAGKFLEFFTDYPWLHIDIAGTAYLPKPRAYRPSGGTGEMVRTLLEFIKDE
ncbi:MAG: leucyl aminopeptidase family protein [Bacteroidales bacterium]